METLQKILSGLTNLPTWLQLAWLLWVVAGLVLLFVSAHKWKGHEEDEGPRGTYVPTPIPSKSEATVNVNVGGVTVIVNVITVEGHDSRGKRAKFEISVLSKECYWECRSTTTVLLNKEPVDMLAFFSSPGMQSRLNKVEDVIAIGAASEEGSLERENLRALARSNQLIHWLRQTVTKDSSNLWTLSLGKLKGEGVHCDEGSDLNRSIVLVGVLEKDDDVNLREALWNKLENNKALPFEVSRYYKFELTNVGQAVSKRSNQ